ncbi:hypothetical protein, variant [Fonticula alba]|uniref:Endonuclease n=1 Tax=Fonticula alba TaxID=691883 RepID=A0A058Z4G8_FONAL|nr:hypothetical protein, variant [Fonticula alba]KCV69184.1 hypothetical protein, variant [Fonticula alba]|eukprot:XP_009496755.1 hypothetical protein, variant [Fonticula alba]
MYSAKQLVLACSAAIAASATLTATLLGTGVPTSSMSNFWGGGAKSENVAAAPPADVVASLPPASGDASPAAGGPARPAYTQQQMQDLLRLPMQASQAADHPVLGLIGQYGLQGSEQLIDRENYLVLFNRRTRTPTWTLHHINQEYLHNAKAKRPATFNGDPELSPLFRVEHRHYGGFPDLNRGHMVPAGDRHSDQDEKDSTFFMSNVVPQNRSNNSGYWGSIEAFIRRLVTSQAYQDVIMYTGPVYAPRSVADERGAAKGTTGPRQEGTHTSVEYLLINSKQPTVGVPTHLFKVILATNPKGSGRKQLSLTGAPLGAVSLCRPSPCRLPPFCLWLV